MFVGHDRSDDVDHLRQVRHLDDVRVAEEGIEEHPHRQRVFKIVDLFQLFAIAGAIPDVPFVVCNINGPRVCAGPHLSNQPLSYVDVIVDRL